MSMALQDSVGAVFQQTHPIVRGADDLVVAIKEQDRAALSAQVNTFPLKMAHLSRQVSNINLKSSWMQTVDYRKYEQMSAKAKKLGLTKMVKIVDRETLVSTRLQCPTNFHPS